MRRIVIGAALALALCAGTSVGVDAEEAPRVELETSKGTIVLELYAEEAPETVANFLEYARQGHYQDTIFHRVIDGFMIQGGGFDAELEKLPTGEPIPNEADNGLKNERGTIAMARTGDPHSATAQFFINTVDNPALDHTGASPQGWGYAVFGRVVEGMDVVDSIAAVPTHRVGPMGDVPSEPVVIRGATALEPE